MTPPLERLVQVALSVPEDLTLPGMDAMNARTRELLEVDDPLVRVRRLGASRDGEDIELISIGKGSRSALVVGTPHPNEPIGCLTIEFLIELLRRDDALREALDVTWHFVKSIEPDGLRLNEGWLSRPFDVELYLRNFFRPAAREQAEYCFPMDIPGYRFSASTPENLAWQEAIRLTQPQLQYSLHNCEFGGAFYVLSKGHAGLAAALARQPQLFGMPVESFGEAMECETSYAPGVFAAFDPEAVVSAELGAGRTGARTYDAGQSSFGFCRPQGTFGLIAEAPLWRQSTPPRIGATLETVASAQRTIRRLAADVVNLLDRHLPDLEALQWRHASRFRVSLLEMRAYAELNSRVILPWDAGMPPSTIARKRQGALLNLLRPVGMLLRLADAPQSANADLAGPVSARNAAERLLAESLRNLGLIEEMEAVPLKISVGVQVLAGLQAAVMLR